VRASWPFRYDFERVLAVDLYLRIRLYSGLRFLLLGTGTCASAISESSIDIISNELGYDTSCGSIHSFISWFRFWFSFLVSFLVFSNGVVCSSLERVWRKNGVWSTRLSVFLEPDWNGKREPKRVKVQDESDLPGRPLTTRKK
jgi:hypothetical protein